MYENVLFRLGWHRGPDTVLIDMAKQPPDKAVSMVQQHLNELTEWLSRYG